jgi:hypothetical protein
MVRDETADKELDQRGCIFCDLPHEESGKSWKKITIMSKDCTVLDTGALEALQ